MDNAVLEWWDIHQTAKYLKVSQSFVRKLVRTRRIPFARAGGKILRFQKVELDRWLAASSCDGNPTKS